MCGTTLGGERLLCWRRETTNWPVTCEHSWFSGCGTQLTAPRPDGRSLVSLYIFMLVVIEECSTGGDCQLSTLRVSVDCGLREETTAVQLSFNIHQIDPRGTSC